MNYHSLKNSYNPIDNTYINSGNIYKPSFHVITLNTPNYDDIGCYGANCLKKYCDIHNYMFSMYRENLEPGIHINFTKNRITIETLKKSVADYIVIIDSDIEILNPSIRLESLFTPHKDTVFYAPQDYFENDKKKNYYINGGFMIWKNCKRSIEINEFWIEKAKSECNILMKIQAPQQSIFENCVLPYLNPWELQFLDHKKVGMLYSSFIKQTKKTKNGWINMGKPKLLDCKFPD